MDRLDVLSGPGSLRQEEKLFDRDASGVNERLDARDKEIREKVKRGLDLIRRGGGGPPYPVGLEETKALLDIGLDMEELRVAEQLAKISSGSLSHTEGIRFSPPQDLVDEYVKMAKNMR